MVWIWVNVMGCGVSPGFEAEPVEDGWLNQPPEVHEVWLDSDQGDVRSTWHAGADGHDPEGEPLSWHYSWKVDGRLIQEGASPMLLPGPFVRGDVIEVAVLAIDTWGAPSLPKHQSSEVGNATPEVGVVHLSPTPLTTEDEVHCDAVDADPDGDSTTQEVRWYVGDEEIVGSESVLVPGRVHRGDLVSCGVASTDGTVTSEERVSEQILVENALPKVLSGSISPAFPGVSDTLTVVEVVVEDGDLDGVETQIAWWVEGVFVGHGRSLEPPLPANAEVMAEVHPYDGWAYGEPYRTEPVRVGE